MSNRYGLAFQGGGQLLFTENGRVMQSGEIIKKLYRLYELETGKGTTTWEQDLDAALQKAADQGVMVESVRANYIAVDDGRALLIDVHTEQTRRASK